MGIERREFLGTAIGAGLGAAIAAGGAPSVLAARQGLRLEEATVSGLQEAMRSGETTSRQLVQAYLRRAATVDKQVNSMIELNPDALQIADQMDRERKSGKVRGPLHGVPVVLKDNIDTADKMKTTAGSLALLNAPTPKKDAFIAARLREAGAVILGKTNLSEWANFRDNDSISGWSGRGGQTRNPYILDRNPCGSSSGSGAAISANIAAVAIGTETDGSIVCPSSVCGIVGLKPTIGLVSRSGIIPIAHSQDTAGPMTRSVADAAAVLTAICGFDEADEAMAGREEAEPIDYTKFLDAGALKGARIGVARNYFGRRKDVDDMLNASMDAMKKAGAVLVDVTIDSIGKFGAAEFEVLLYEFKTDLEKYLAGRNADHKTLDDLIQFNKDNEKREMPYFGQSIFEAAAKKGPLTDEAYVEALETCKRLTQAEGIDQVMDRDKLDAIIGPSNAPTWMIDTVNGDCGSGYISSSSLAAVAGYPNITVPAAFSKELPLGISFFGKAFTEAKLIGIAYAFEQATKARRQPKLLPTFA